MVKKRIAGIILAMVMASTSFGTVNDFTETWSLNGIIRQDNDKNNEIEVSKDKKSNNNEIDNVDDIPELEDLNEKEQRMVNKAVEVADESGEEAGETLNELGNRSDAVEVGVKEVLDTYFSADVVDEEKVEEFDLAVDIDIKETVEAYKTAREERDNEDNLEYVTGEELVIFDKDTSKEEIDAIVNGISDSYEIILDNEFEIDDTLSERKKERLKALENYETDIVVRVKLDLDQTVESAAEEFEQFDCVVEAEENVKCETSGLTSEVNDTYGNKQYYLDTCNFKDAWDSVETAGCNDIWIAVVDTGCNINHPDLKGSIVSKYAVDVTQTDKNGNYVKLADLEKPYDTNHGTVVTGIIAANSNNAKGIAGAARGWNNDRCRVIPIKVSHGVQYSGNPDEENPYIEEIDYADIIKGMDYAIKSGAEIINVCIREYGNSQGYKKIADKAEKAGVVVVACAGNDGKSIKPYPAALDNVIAVGGTEEKNLNKKYSDSNYGSWVNIVAPATGFISTDTGENGYYTKNTYKGTSFATPLVSSAVGLMLCMNPDLKPSEVRTLLYDSATNIKSAYFNCGFLNAGLAVQKAKYTEFKNSSVSLTKVKSYSGKGIRLYWDLLDVYGPEIIQIYRATSIDGKYTKINTIKDDDLYDYAFNGFVDKNVTVGTTYYYKIRVAMRYGKGYKYTPFSKVLFTKAIN